MNLVPRQGHFDLSPAAAPGSRQAMIEKMRSKLAGVPESIVHKRALRSAKARAAVAALAWKVGLAAAALAVNLLLFGREGAGLRKPENGRDLALDFPARTLSVNDQALYWAYALYDYDLLKLNFGAPRAAIVDANLARGRLAVLLPKADRKTRFIIQGYLPRGRGRA